MEGRVVGQLRKSCDSEQMLTKPIPPPTPPLWCRHWLMTWCYHFTIHIRWVAGVQWKNYTIRLKIRVKEKFSRSFWDIKAPRLSINCLISNFQSDFTNWIDNITLLIRFSHLDFLHKLNWTKCFLTLFKKNSGNLEVHETDERIVKTQNCL